MHWRPAFVAIGSNLSDPVRQVTTAFESLAAIPATRLMLRSSLWKTRPMGPADQPDFVNAVAGVITQRTAAELLGQLQAIEQRMGRRAPLVRWGPRLIDLDLLMVGDLQSGEAGLRLPHPGLHQRNFVLYPLAEIAAEVWVPGHGRVRSLQQQVSGTGIERLA